MLRVEQSSVRDIIVNLARTGTASKFSGTIEAFSEEYLVNRMSQQSGVCAIVPEGQDGYRPQVLGMGVLVDRREIVTCAHVINLALGSDWQKSSTPSVVRVCFPFTAECVNGTVDRNRWFPPGRAKGPEPSDDIAVIQLSHEAPPSVEHAFLKQHVDDAAAKAYGFRGKEVDGRWISHPDGEYVEGKIMGPLPGGRAQFEGLRSTGARVEKGFSGAGVYDSIQKAVVGMIVEHDRDINRIAQFIDVRSLESALGKQIAQQRPQPRPEAKLTQPETSDADLKRLRKYVLETTKQVRGAWGFCKNRMDEIDDKEHRIPSFPWRTLRWPFTSFYIVETDFLKEVASKIRNRSCRSWLDINISQFSSMLFWRQIKVRDLLKRHSQQYMAMIGAVRKYRTT